jgi:histidinol-phosphate aminotransferase
LPGVRSALIESIDAANRYPEFLPERLRSLIAGHVGVREEQVVIGVGATGVIMQVLRAVTSPGDTMVMTSPTFDGYPIFAQMARLRSVTVTLDQHGHHDLDAMAEAACQAKVVVVCRPHNPTGTVEPAADIELFLQRVRHSSSGSPMSSSCARSRRHTALRVYGSATGSARRRTR